MKFLILNTIYEIKFNLNLLNHLLMLLFRIYLPSPNVCAQMKSVVLYEFENNSCFYLFEVYELSILKLIILYHIY